MSVTASFQPDRVSAIPGQTAALALRLLNSSDSERMVTLRPGGDLAERTVLQTETVFLDPNEQFDIPVVFDADASFGAGSYSCVVELIDGDATTNAEATVDINAAAAWTARLEPERSASSSVGRHKVVIDNSGNVPVMVELTATSDSHVTTELAAHTVNVEPGKTAKVELRVTPPNKFANGDAIEHLFTINLMASDGEQTSFDGVFEQGPRMRPWVAPALAGMVGSLVLGGLAWITTLKPSVEEAARTEAIELDTAQQVLLDERVQEIQLAAEEASKLPLGEPTDQRLEVSAPATLTATQSFDVDEQRSGRTFYMTDVIFQNPTGGVGRVQLIRDDEIVLDQEMANFRDLDFHLIAPIRVNSGSTLGLQITCTTPGPGADECQVAATVVGFVDGP